MSEARNVTEKEAELLKRTFAGNDELLKSIRALMFNLGVSADEKKLIKQTFSSPELRTTMWKRFYPQLDRDTEIGQVQDVWLGAEQMVFGAGRDSIYQAVTYKRLALEMTKRALELLEDPDGEPIDLRFDGKKADLAVDDLQTGLLGRNQFIRHVEQQLLFLKIVANQSKSATASDKKKRSTE